MQMSNVSTDEDHVAKSQKLDKSNNKKRKPTKALSSEPKFHKSSGTLQQRGSIATAGVAPALKTVSGIETLVDPLCSLADRAHVVVMDGVPLDATLNLVDSATNANKFYRVQTLAADGASFLWTRWGAAPAAT